MARSHSRIFDLLIAALIASVATLTGGCGGVQFDRTEGVAKYPAVPAKSKVLLAEALEDVPQPAVVVGVMTLPASSNALSQEQAENRFLSYARRFGCTAVVDVDAHASQVEKRKKERVLKDGGKVEIKTSKSTVLRTQWMAQCVRTIKSDAKPTPTVAKAKPPAATAKTSATPAATAKPKPKTVDMTNVRSDEQVERLKARAAALRKAQRAAERAVAQAQAAAAAARKATEAHEAKLERTSGKTSRSRAKAKKPKKRAAPHKASKAPAPKPVAAETAEERRERARQEAIAKLRANQEAARSKNAAAAKAQQAAAARKQAQARRRAEKADEARKNKEAAARRKAEAARKKQQAAEARKQAADEKKRLKAEAERKAAEEKARKKAEAKRKAEEEKARKIAEAKRKTEEEKARKQAAEKARLAAIVKRFDDAIAGAQVAAIADAIHAHPEHAKVPAANAALQKAALARVDQWLVAVAPTKTRKGAARHGWQATNPTKAPAVVFFEVAGQRLSTFLKGGKSAKGHVDVTPNTKGATRLLGVFVVTRELAIDKNAVLANAPLTAIAKVWTEAPDTPLTPVFLARISRTLASQNAATSSIRGSIRAKRRPAPDEYQPAKVSLKNTASRDVTVVYDAGTGRIERLLLKSRGSMSLTLMIPPEHKAALKVIAVLPRLRTLAWLSGDWSLGSARLVLLPAGKKQVAAFVISTTEPRVIPLATTSDAKSVIAKGKVPDGFARTVFFDLSGCENGCDATLTIPLAWQDKYNPKGGRTLRFKAAISSRNGTAKFVADY